MMWQSYFLRGQGMLYATKLNNGFLKTKFKRKERVLF